MMGCKDSVHSKDERVGNYFLVSMIAKGAFSEVWLANHHERDAAPVAIKIPTDNAFRKQFVREARLPEFLHPNIVPILDSDTRFADLPYLVMPYYAKGNLRKLIQSSPGGLPEDMVARLLSEISNGLEVAHSRGVIHQDIKPENVLIGDNEEAVLADFGLCAIPLEVESVIQSGSGIGAIAGTLEYMAPEVRNGGGATAVSDVFGVGICLFEMLTRRRPCGPEKPSNVRLDLRMAESWDALYSQACSPPEARATSHQLRKRIDLISKQLQNRTDSSSLYDDAVESVELEEARARATEAPVEYWSSKGTGHLGSIYGPTIAKKWSVVLSCTVLGAVLSFLAAAVLGAIWYGGPNGFFDGIVTGLGFGMAVGVGFFILLSLIAFVASVVSGDTPISDDLIYWISGCGAALSFVVFAIVTYAKLKSSSFLELSAVGLFGLPVGLVGGFIGGLSRTKYSYR